MFFHREVEGVHAQAPIAHGKTDAVVGFLGNNLDGIIKAVFGSCGFVWG